jgi:zinc transporter 1/2/3
MAGVYLKSELATAIFVSSICSIAIPLYSTRFKTNNHWNSLANAFSGGVFLAICMLHLLPEAAEALNSESRFPVSYLIAIVSCSFILYIEKVAFDSHELMSHGEGHTDLGIHHRKGSCHEDEDRMKHELNMRNRFTEHLKVGMGDRKIQPGCENLCSKEEPLLPKKEHPQLGMAPYLLAIALSLHSVFEGMAIGIQTNDTKVFELGFSVMVHKFPEAFALGVSLNKFPEARTMAVISIFTLATPLGIASSMLMIGCFESVEGVVLSLSAGTFLYIALSEIVVEEFSVSRHKYTKFLCFVGGVGLVSLLVLFFEV